VCRDPITRLAHHIYKLRANLGKRKKLFHDNEMMMIMID